MELKPLSNLLHSTNNNSGELQPKTGNYTLDELSQDANMKLLWKKLISILQFKGGTIKPIELTYKHISNATHLTPEQVKYGIQKLINAGLIHKWNTRYISYKTGLPKKSSYYKLIS